MPDAASDVIYHISLTYAGSGTMTSFLKVLVVTSSHGGLAILVCVVVGAATICMGKAPEESIPVKVHLTHQNLSRGKAIVSQPRPSMPDGLAA